ncbi:MAG: hypothetical protein P8Z00_25290, partial [Anaerolineales bacterium]
MPYRAQCVAQEILAAIRPVLSNAPIAVQVGITPILQHLGQPGDPIERVAGGLPGGAGLQPVAEPVVGVAHRAGPIRDAGQAIGAIIGV